MTCEFSNQCPRNMYIAIKPNESKQVSLHRTDTRTATASNDHHFPSFESRIRRNQVSQLFICRSIIDAHGREIAYNLSDPVSGGQSKRNHRNWQIFMARFGWLRVLGELERNKSTTKRIETFMTNAYLATSEHYTYSQLPIHIHVFVV